MEPKLLDYAAPPPGCPIWKKTVLIGLVVGVIIVAGFVAFVIFYNEQM